MPDYCNTIIPNDDSRAIKSMKHGRNDSEGSSNTDSQILCQQREA